MDINSIFHFWRDVVSEILNYPLPTAIFTFILVVFLIYKSATLKNNISLRTRFILTLKFSIPLFFFVTFVLLTEALALRAFQLGITTNIAVDTLRWLAIYGTLLPLTFILSYRSNPLKSTIVMFSHLLLFLIGWRLWKWGGIILVAVPTSIIFYILLYRIAQVIIPTPRKRDSQKEEKTKAFWAFFWYLWGGQYPFWAAKKNTSRIIDQKVSGNYYKFYGGPGVIYTLAHQTVAISFGIQFSRVDGPGIIFTRRFEHPIAIVDLRKQIRTLANLEATTQDGIPISAVLFVSFAIDTTNWKTLPRNELHNLWRKVPALRQGSRPDRNIGSSYPYSPARIRVALSSAGTKKTPDAEKDSAQLYWDEIAMQRIEKSARHVLSERTFDQLWTPRNDYRGASALDEIAKAIKENATPKLREMGVQLFSSRVINFNIPTDAPIRRQLIQNWLAVWEQRTKSAVLDGETAAKMSRIRAQASTNDTFLQSITESLKKARSIDPNLPKQVVALNFIATLERLLQNQNQNADNEGKLAIWRDILLRSNH